ncbi:MAG: type II secretion system minor pseudopilin GspJ [Caulobacter sp.]
MRRAGFTLVEMLTALMIFGILTAAGAAVMGGTLTSQRAVKSRVEQFSDFQRLRAVIRTDLGQAAGRLTRDATGQQALASFIGGDPWGGQPDRLLVLVRRGWENPDQAGRASMQYVEYRLVEGRLERRARPALDGAPLGPPLVLVEGVRQARVAFLYRGAWQASWKGVPETALPQAVRLELSLDGVGQVTQLFLTTGEAP